MGCWSSKQGESGLVALCRTRRALIREAADHRYALAVAHASYFRSLAIVGDALLRYAREGMPPGPALAPEIDAHVVTLPASRKGSESDGSGGSSATPLSHSLSDEGSHLHISSDSEVEVEVVVEAGGGKGGDRPPGPSTSYHYMRSSTATPNMVYYGDPYGEHYGFSGGYVNDQNYYYGSSVSPPVPARASPPLPTPPPPSAQGFGWDFFNPFYSYDQSAPGFSPGQYGMASYKSSPSSSEVRAREGIPDLEDEAELEPLTRMKKNETGVEDFHTKDSGIGSYKNVPKKEIEEDNTSKSNSGEESKVSSADKGNKKSSATSIAGRNSEHGLSSKKKGVTFHEESSLLSEKRGGSDGELLSVDDTRDVVEALGDIREGFISEIISSEEVSRALEVGKLPYRPRNKLFRAISSRMLVFVGFRIPSRLLFKNRHRLVARTMKRKFSNVELDKNVSMKDGLLSLTLEKLYLWEKKLFEEVKAEERLRSIYEKKCRRLQSLDDRGAEPHTINAVQVSIRSIRTKISIAITSVDVISRRMHSIMDEELQPQLVKLIQELIKMWKLLAGFHQQQLKAIISSKNYNLSIGAAFQDSVRKATKDLELILLKWYSTFDKWISTQKAFVDALNEWLLKWFPSDRSGIAAFSPAMIGAPPLFILTNDWSKAINKCSEAEVKAAIQMFAVNMHKLRLSQEEEHNQYQKVDSLSREYSAKLKNLQKEQGNHDILILNSSHIHDDERIATLNTMKKRLDEVKAGHDKTLRHVQEVASISLTTDLVPVFQSLSSFSSDVVRAYEELRVPDRVFGS